MKTSSIVAAAALTVVSLNQAIAGGWIVSARPNVVPLTRMVGVPINRGPASFAPADRFGPFNHFNFANRFGTRFGPFGEFGFQRPFGEFGFQQPFGEFGFQQPFGGFGFQQPFGGFGRQQPFGVATVFASGDVAPSLSPLSAGGEPPAPQIIWAPSYVTVVSAEPRCGYGDGRFAGGPKIIVIGASPRPTHGEKLPVVIYGTHGGCV